MRRREALERFGPNAKAKIKAKRTKGAGAVERGEEIVVTVPPGVDTGTRIRKPGHGMPGVQGGPAGDLIVIVRAGEHEHFQRNEFDVHMEVPVSFADAALGSKVTVPTIHGEERVAVEAGTQPGDVQRISGKGVPRLNGRGMGDHYVHWNIKIPKKLSREQRKLLEQYRDTTD